MKTEILMYDDEPSSLSKFGAERFTLLTLDHCKAMGWIGLFSGHFVFLDVSSNDLGHFSYYPFILAKIVISYTVIEGKEEEIKCVLISIIYL